MAAAFAFGKRGANNRAPVSNYLISKGFDFDGVKVGPDDALAICVRGEPVDTEQAESAQPSQRRLSRNRTGRPRIQPPSTSA